jgi:hypothetical protein
MLGHVEVKNSPPIMRDNEEAVQDAKVQHWYGEEVHRCDNFTMIVQKGRPSFRRLRAPWRSPNPAQHRTLRNLEAKHLQLTVNSRCTPSLVLGHHAEDQGTQFPTHALSARSSSVSRNPRPIQLEDRPMPANNCLRLHDDQCPPPADPEPAQHHPEQFVGSSKSRRRMFLFENAELLPQRQVFQEQVPA